MQCSAGDSADRKWFIGEESMSHRQSLSKRGVLKGAYAPILPPLQTAQPYRGHNHFWQRALSRRSFLVTAAGVAGASLVFGQRPSSGADPRPIPGGIQPFGPGTEVFHVFLIGPGVEPSTITDFNGFVGATEIQGPWTVSGPSAPTPVPPTTYDADMRFMTGEYIGADGRHHLGTFGFI
jgi:hypothetical protein